jgi:hypothetical protein
MEFYDQWKNVIVFWLLRSLIEKERIAGSYCRAPKGKGTPFTPAPLAGHPPNLARASSGRCPKRLSAQTRASCPGFLELAAVTPPDSWVPPGNSRLPESIHHRPKPRWASNCPISLEDVRTRKPKLSLRTARPVRSLRRAIGQRLWCNRKRLAVLDASSGASEAVAGILAPSLGCSRDKVFGGSTRTGLTTPLSGALLPFIRVIRERLPQRDVSVMLRERR